MTITQPDLGIVPFADFLDYLDLDNPRHKEAATEATTGYAASLVAHLFQNPDRRRQITEAYLEDLVALPDRFADSIVMELAHMSEYALLTARSLDLAPLLSVTFRGHWDLTETQQDLYRQWVGLVLTAGAMGLASNPELLTRFHCLDLYPVALKASHEAMAQLPDPHSALEEYRYNENPTAALEDAAAQPLLQLGEQDTTATLTMVLDCAGEPMEDLQMQNAFDYTHQVIAQLISAGTFDLDAIRPFLDDLHHMAPRTVQAIIGELAAITRHVLDPDAEGPRQPLYAAFEDLTYQELLEARDEACFLQWFADLAWWGDRARRDVDEPTHQSLITQARVGLVATITVLGARREPALVLEEYLTAVS